MEILKNINTKDGHIIYGTLNSSEKKSDKLIIFVHGFTGNQTEHQYFNAVPFFTSRGFDTFRFDFYSGEKKSRSIDTITFNEQTGDLNLVINKFKDKYEELFIVGHSLGPLIILHANISDIRKIVFWDPTAGFNISERKNYTFDKNTRKYLRYSGLVIIVSKELFEGWANQKIDLQIQKLKTPVKFIFAEYGNKFKLWEKVISDIKVQHEVVQIPNATHCFTEEGTANKLYEETLKWLV